MEDQSDRGNQASSVRTDAEIQIPRQCQLSSFSNDSPLAQLGFLNKPGDVTVCVFYSRSQLTPTDIFDVLLHLRAGVEE